MRRASAPLAVAVLVAVVADKPDADGVWRMGEG
jgi:hypothetical protein